MNKSNVQDHSKGILQFCPRRFCHTGIREVSLGELKARDVKIVLIDLDNTITGWQSSEISKEIREWIKELQNNGIKLCIVSNTRHGKRLISVAKDLEVHYVKRAWKPRKHGFLQAMKDLGGSPENTVMIGDQMFTDVLGGNRVGIYTVMVKPMYQKEFFGTKISRLFEFMLMRKFRKRKMIAEKSSGV